MVVLLFITVAVPVIADVFAWLVHGVALVVAAIAVVGVALVALAAAVTMFARSFTCGYGFDQFNVLPMRLIIICR